MYIVSDLGTEMVNADNVCSIGIVPNQGGGSALVAFAVAASQTGPIFTPLTLGSKQRCEQAMAAIRKGLEERENLVDLLGLLGTRPQLTVAQAVPVVPNGDIGQP